MSQDEPRRALSPDDALPPVAPPTAGFIVQLFVVPAAIVTVIALVWLMFVWLAQMGTDPKEYVDQIRKNNANSWIAAHNLAQELRLRKELKRDRELASRLAALLDERTRAQKTDEDAVKSRIFLCRALGEFEVHDGLPELLAAACEKSTDETWPVKRAAIEALAVRADPLRGPQESAAFDSRMLPVLLDASRDEEAGVREAAAYALGVIGGDEADQRLREMLRDANPNAVANAATGLARRGDAASLDSLIAMIDPQETSWLRDEKDQARDFKRAAVMINGLRGARQLAETNPDIDRSRLVHALHGLLADTTDSWSYAHEVRSHAKALLDQLEGRSSSANE